MNKTLIIIALTVLTYTNINSQSLLGIRGSFNASSLSSNGAINRPGFNIGAMYSTQLSDSWHFQPALLYNFSSIRSADEFKFQYSAYTYNLEMPLTVSRRFGDEDLSFGIDVGTFLKYGLHGGYWRDNPTTGERSKFNIFDYQKRFDVGPQIGFSILARGFYIGYSFQYGLIKPWSEKRGNFYSSSINIAYMFHLE